MAKAFDNDTLPDPAGPEWLSGWLYAEREQAFVRSEGSEILSESAFERRYVSAGKGKGVGQSKNPRKLYFTRPEKRLVSGLIFAPGHGPHPVIDGRRWANTWRELTILTAARDRTQVVTDHDVQPWLDHMALLVPDRRDREILLNWMTWVAKYPRAEDKPNWAVFLGGGQGIGKDTLFRPFRLAIGQQYTRQIVPEMLYSPFNAWLECRLIEVQEMRSFETTAVANRLKAYITRPPETVEINQKNIPVRQAPNCAAFLFMSNHRDALHLEDDDRRYFVLWSDAQASGQEYFDRLHRWLDEGGSAGVVAYLLRRDVAAFRSVVAGRAPGSAAKDEMRRVGGNDAVRTLTEMIEDRVPPFAADIVSLTDVIDALGGARRPKLRDLEIAIRRCGGGSLSAESAGGRRIKARRYPGAEPTVIRIWAVCNLARWQGVPTAALCREYERGRGSAGDVQLEAVPKR